MHKYEVGKLYNPNRTSWPEAYQYNYRQGGHELLLFFRYPEPDEIWAVKKGQFQAGVLYEDGVIFLLFRFRKKNGEHLEGDAPYSYHLVSGEWQTIPQELKEGERILLQIILVDAGTGIIRAMRAVSLAHELSKKLTDAIIDQSGKPFPVDYDVRIQKIYGKYPDASDMFAAAEK